MKKKRKQRNSLAQVARTHAGPLRRSSDATTCSPTATHSTAALLANGQQQRMDARAHKERENLPLPTSTGATRTPPHNLVWFMDVYTTTHALCQAHVKGKVEAVTQEIKHKQKKNKKIQIKYEGKVDRGTKRTRTSLLTRHQSAANGQMRLSLFLSLSSRYRTHQPKEIRASSRDNHNE